MANTCTVCAHSEKEAINALLVRGEGNRDIAGQYDLKKSSVDRHKRNHLDKQLARANKKDILTAEGLLEEAQGLFASVKRVFDRLEENPEDTEMFLKANKECHRNLELLARLCGQLETTSTVNVFLNPIFLGVRTRLVRALAQYPEAREAAVKALTDPDGGDFIPDLEDAPGIVNVPSNPTKE